MTQLLLTIIIGIGIAAIAAGSALYLFQSARDGYDQQLLWARMEQTAAAIRAKTIIIDGLPTVPMAQTSSDSYPIVPTWVTPNALDTGGHNFVYCPFALRDTIAAGTSTTVTGPGYSVVTYSSSITGSNSYVVGATRPTLAGTQTAAAQGLIGVLIAFKPKDTYSATAAQTWCNNLTVSSTGVITATAASTSGVVYPLVVPEQLTQQAFAKHDTITMYVSTSAAGDGTGRNPANYTTLDAAFAQLSALRPYRAKLYLTAGTHSLSNINRLSTTQPAATLTPSAVSGNAITLTAGSSIFTAANVGQTVTSGTAIATITGYTSGTVVTAAVSSPFASTSAISSGSWSLSADVYNRGNLNQIIYDIQGQGLASTTITLNANYDLPVNTYWRSLTLSPASSQTLTVPANSKTVIQNAAVSNLIVKNGTAWVDGTSQINTAVTVTDTGRLVINGTATSSTTNQGILIKAGRVDVTPTGSWTITTTNTTGQPKAPLIVYGAGILGNSGAMTITSSGVALASGINVVPGGQVFMNNATITFNTGTGSIAGDAGNYDGKNGAPGVVVLGGEMYLDNSGLLFPSGTAASVAAVELVDGGRFYMHNASYIGSTATAAARPYYGVYDDGGSFVGGSSTGYSTGANGEGGSPQSHVYIATASGAQCWAGNLLPSSPPSGSSQQQRNLFWDSPEGSGTTSAPRGTTSSTGTGDIDLRHLVIANQSNWACTSANSVTSPSAFMFASSGAASCNASYTSEVIEPTNFNAAATISIASTGAAANSPPQYSINGGAFTSSSGTISPGQTVQVKVYEATANSSTSTATLTIGSQTANVSTTTTGSCYSGVCSHGSQTFTSGTSFNVPANCTSLTVEVYGGGGAAYQSICPVGSGGWAVTSRELYFTPVAFKPMDGLENGFKEKSPYFVPTGSGFVNSGAGGGYSSEVFTVTGGQTITYSIGAGATTAGSTGGTTTATVSATTITATGGHGATTKLALIPGGTGSGGTTNNTGGIGTAQTTCTNTNGGAGAAPLSAAGGVGGTDPPNGTAPGGGGGVDNTDAVLGWGATGEVIFTY